MFSRSRSSSATPSATVPTGMPTLRRGSHASAKDGACFMEYASILAGSRFSDRPPCTPPALAALARAVNDAVGERTRDSLLPLVPSVICDSRHVRRPTVGPLVARLCTERALTVAVTRGCLVPGCSRPFCAHQRSLVRAQARANRRLTLAGRMALTGRAPGRLRSWLWTSSAEPSLALAVAMLGPSGDDVLVDLLRDAIAVSVEPTPTASTTPLARTIIAERPRRPRAR